MQSTSTDNNSESSTCEIKNVFYLKGLDAYQQRSHKQDKSENQAADKQADRLPLIDPHNSPPLPIGSSQLDYFHRLAGQIKGPHDDIDLKKRDSGIKAVGIFGADFHDKLLILEALRAQMSNILVFTTDLNAQMPARTAYFDNQDFPLSKGITFAVSISLLFFSGFMLRYEAEKLKRLVIQSAENLGKTNRSIQPEARKVIERIKGICEGAFEPMFEQPVLRALLIILASAGLFVGEYLKLFE